jgi:hypothetical protein
MKKIGFLVLMVAILGLFAIGQVSSEDFIIEVDIPQADSANFLVWKLTDGQPFPANPEASNTLNFTTTLTQFEGGDSAFLGDNFYALDIFPTGGAGLLNVNVTYADTQNQNGPLNDGSGIGGKGIATVVRAPIEIDTQNPAFFDEVQLSRTLLQDVPAIILASDIEDPLARASFMRMYVGLATGDPAATPPEPAGAVPFNLADQPGIYSGLLTLTVSQP